MDIRDKDTRQKLEEDARAVIFTKYVSVDDMRGWLDRQAAITRAETCGCPGYDADRHYCKYHANDFELTREQVCDLKREVSRLQRERDKLQAKLDAIDETHTLPDRDPVGIMRKCAAKSHGMSTLRAALGVDCMSGWQMRCISTLADMVERDYLRLPLDADGETIRIGDTVRELGDKVPMKVMSLTFYEDCVDVNAYGMNPNLLMHVKPRTIEDVLMDVINEAFDDEDGYSVICKRYADEIRELMEVE